MTARGKLRKFWGALPLAGLLAWIAYDLMDGAIEFWVAGEQIILTGFLMVVFVAGLLAAFFAHLFESRDDSRLDWDRWTFWAGLGGAFAAYIAGLLGAIT